MFAVLVASVALYLPATRLRCAPVRLLLEPRDDMKVGFSRGADDGPRTDFAPKSTLRENTEQPKTVNEQLLDEIQALMPPEKAAPKEAKPVDLNGIKPRDLLNTSMSRVPSRECHSSPAWPPGCVLGLAAALRTRGGGSLSRAGPIGRLRRGRGFDLRREQAAAPSCSPDVSAAVARLSHEQQPAVSSQPVTACPLCTL